VAELDFLPAWTASGGLQYVGARYADNANTLKLPAYTTTDLALRWKATQATTLTLRANNVFDKHYFTTAYYTNTQWLYGPGTRAAVEREPPLLINGGDLLAGACAAGLPDPPLVRAAAC
jgi:outer membrane receptor protein involved in Fe transport